MTKHKKIILLAIFLLNIIVVYLFKINIGKKEVLEIHAFLFLLSFLEEKVRIKIIKNNNKSIYSLYINFFKIISCLIFLMPNIFSNNTYIYTFFSTYFLILFYDIFVVLKTDKINK